MENKKIYFEKHVRSRCSKLRRALQNVTAKVDVKEIKKGRNQEYSPGRCDKNIKEKGGEERSKDIKVTETYDEVLDLRNTLVTKDLTNREKSKYFTKYEAPVKKNKFLDKVCEIPNMHYKIMTLCSVKNSTKFSEEFNAKTNIISERIVNKQLELQNQDKPWKPKKTRKLSPVVGGNTVVQKIIEKEKELQNKKTVMEAKCKSETNTQKISQERNETIPNSESDVNKTNERNTKHLNSRPRFQLSTKALRPSETKLPSRMNFIEKPSRPLFNPILEPKDSRGSSKALMQISAASSLERSIRPRFLLSTKPNRRCAISHSSIQVTMEKSCTDNCTQTEEEEEQKKKLRNMLVQTCKKITNAKKMQTRLLKTYSAETDPIFIEGSTKYTNTLGEYPCSEQTTQMYEHLTISDVVVLDWVNRHLFGVNVNPNNIVVDDKIREVSEVVSKSTFLSEIESFIV